MVKNINDKRKLRKLLASTPTAKYIATLLLCLPFAAYSSELTEGLQAYKAKEYSQARVLFLEACKKNSAKGCHNAGVMAAKGQGGSKDKEEAKRLYDQSCGIDFTKFCRARKGEMQSISSYLKGKANQSKKPVDKVQKLRRISLKRCLDPQRNDRVQGKICNRVGLMLSKGEGGPQDREQARKLFEKACKGGFARGCNNAALMYAAGEGGAKDMKLAESLFAQACEGGLTKSCGQQDSKVAK